MVRNGMNQNGMERNGNFKKYITKVRVHTLQRIRTEWNSLERNGITWIAHWANFSVVPTTTHGAHNPYSDYFLYEIKLSTWNEWNRWWNSPYSCLFRLISRAFYSFPSHFLLLKLHTTTQALRLMICCKNNTH